MPTVLSRCTCWLGACLALGLITPAAAQSVPQRRTLVVFRDSLAAVRDTGALRRAEASLIARAKRDPDDAMGHLRLGLLALRLGDLGAPRSYDDAGSEFQWTIELQPRWPWGWYGLGLAELGVGDSEVLLVSGLQTMLGKDALTRSANAFAKSAEVDPTFVKGLVELANTALQQRVNVRTDVALAALRRAGRTSAAGHPDVLLARARIEREVGSPDSSAVALRALARRDSTSSLLQYELARTAFLRDDPAGEAHWYTGLVTADTATLARYRDDLASLTTDDILDALFVAAPIARVARVRDFWAVRDQAALRPEGARLREHYRRLDFARRNFRLTSTTRQYDISERYRSGQEDVDDRGVIYIRHGPPDARASYIAPDLNANESWQYRRDEGALVLHFVARQDVQDFRLVESVFDVLGFATTVAMRETDARLSDFAHIEGLLRSREVYDATYRRLQGAGRGSAASLLTEERALGRTGILVGTTTDSWPLQFTDTLPGAVQAVATGAAPTGPLLQLGYALDAPGLVADTTAEVQLRASVFSLAGRPVAFVDTVQGHADLVVDGPRVLGRVAVPLPPGRYVVRLAVETPDGGLVGSHDTVDVAPTSADRPTLSAVALGTRGVPLVWVGEAARDSIWLDPSRVFSLRDPLQLYVEVGGIPALAGYRLEMTVRRPGSRSLLRRIFGGGGGRDPAHLRRGASRRRDGHPARARARAPRARPLRAGGAPARECRWPRGGAPHRVHRDPMRGRWAAQLGAALLAVPVAAQSPGTRAALGAHQEELARITDARELVRRREALRAVVRAGPDDPALLRLGQVWLRLAAVSGNPAGFGAARSAFEEVSERHPDWPLAWDGIAEAAWGEHQATSGVITGLLDMFGGQPLHRVARHYVRGAEVDSAHVEGLRALAQQAERSDDADLREVALQALRYAAPLPAAAEPGLRLARARLERDDGELDSALVQLEALVAVAPDGGEANLELARVRFVMGRMDGLTPWYHGLGQADSLVYAAYRRDLAMVFPDSSLARLDAARPGARAAIARREWQRQDPDGLPVVADRLRDHYRRLAFARRHYRLRASVRGPDPLDWFGIFDARGLVYVRHGPPAIRTSLGRHGGPDVTATLRVIGAPPNETWRYGTPDAEARLYHFVVRAPGGDFTLAESAMDILGLTAQYRMFRTEDVPEGVALDALPPPVKTYGAELVSMIAQELLLSRAPAHPIYDRMLREGKGSAEALQLAERTIGRTSVETPPSWALRYELPLDAAVTILAVGQEAGEPQIQVAFAIAGSALLPIRTTRGVGYRVRMRAAVRDATGEVVASVDTVRGFLTGAALRPQDHLLGRLPIPVPPGRHTVRVALEADGLGMIAPRTVVDVAAPRAPTLALSDLAIGTRAVRLPWATAGTDTAWVNPLGTYSPRDPMELYFEVLGLPAGTPYRVDVAVIRVSGRDRVTAEAARVAREGGDAALTIRFDGRHPGGVAGVARELSLARLQSGEYVLEVRVSTGGGTSAVRRQPFLLAP